MEGIFYHKASKELDPIDEAKTLTRIARMNTNSLERHFSPVFLGQGGEGKTSGSLEPIIGERHDTNYANEREWPCRREGMGGHY